LPERNEGAKDRGEYRQVAEAIEPPPGVGSAIRSGGRVRSLQVKFSQ